MNMTWTALAFVIALAIFTLILFAWKHWPRDEHGKPLSVEEVDEFMKKMPTSTPSCTERHVILMFVAIALLALAISGKNTHANSDDSEAGW